MTSLLVETMLDQLPMDDHATVISVKQDNVAAPPSTNGQNSSPSLPRYDPTVAYILEFSTLLATRDADTVESSAKQVFDTVQGILRDPSRWHAITVSRATFYSFKILRASYVSHLLGSNLVKADGQTQDHDFANVPFLLHTVSSLPQEMLVKTSDLVLAGLAMCTDEPGPLRSEMMTSPDFWATLSILARNPESAALVFSILEKGTTGSPPAIMADNYEAAVSLLNDFASAAAPVVLTEQKSEAGQRKVEKKVKM